MPTFNSLKTSLNNTRTSIGNSINQRRNSSPSNSGSHGSSPNANMNRTDHQRQQAGTASEDDQSLSSILSREQRAELSLLVSLTTEEMRQGLVRGFDERPKVKPQLPPRKNDVGDVATEMSELTMTEEDDRVNEAAGEADAVRNDRVNAEPSEEPDALLNKHTPETEALKEAVLTFFDAWAESVILRIGEVVNSRDEATQDKNPNQTRRFVNATKQAYEPTERDKEVDTKLSKIYPAIPTPLSSLNHTERSTILNALLLLLLSLASYKAHSRTLLVRLCISLNLRLAELTIMEKNTAFGLLTAAAKMDATESTQKAQQASSSARKWKIGVAGVAGAALIGITGGLAAPFLAAGVGGLLGGLGLGATAAAGYLGAMAGSSLLVGGLFGAYGARMSRASMEKYAKEIDDFAFLPTHGTDTDSEEIQKERRRLRLTIGITGWLTDEKQVTSPWKVLGHGSEPFALRWELSALMALGTALKDFIVSQAWSQIRKEIIKRTIFAAIWSALLAPLAIRKVIKLVDSPFGNAKNLSVKAGEVLADALINKVQGERPVSLVGQSLGARVIYSCLLKLAERGAFGLIENVVLMGAPVPADENQWRVMRSVVSGRLVNVYSKQDYILAFLYRTSSAQLSIAGLQDIEGVSGVENFDMSEKVAGHLKYMHMTGSILKEVGWCDVDEMLLKEEELRIEEMNAEEKVLEAKGEDPEKADL
jgi:hypothetical protein